MCTSCNLPLTYVEFPQSSYMIFIFLSTCELHTSSTKFLNISYYALKKKKPTSMASEPTSPPHDLKVTIRHFSMVSPIEKTERRYMFLSNIDQAANFNIRTMLFFQPNLDYPPEKVVKVMEDTLPKLLVPYDFLAGRLMFNAIKGRFEVDCNSAGVGFAVASSELTLADLGNLLCPNPALEQLTQELNSLKEDHPILVCQVTSFRCGGFALSVSYNHILMDGTSFLMLLKNLASLAAGKPLAIIPYNDRTLLAARSPPRVTFSHPELVESTDTSAQFYKGTSENIDFKVFHLSENDVMKLKLRAKVDMEEGDANALKITSFNVVTAHVWRCKVLSGVSEKVDNPDQISRILYSVDVRSRLGSPPLPSSYVGNAVVNAYGIVKVKEIEENSFSYLVRKCNEGTSRVSDEYVRSTVDWLEVHKGFPHGDVLVSSWWKLGFEKVEYPWGKPEYSCPLVHRRKDIILFFPDVDGVNIVLALPSSQMKKFQQLFYELADSNTMI